MINYKKLGFLCCLVYFVSYITRINYGAAIAEIVADMQITKEMASYAVTGSFITYGVGQIFSGILGDKFKPRHLIVVGLLGTAIVNLSVVFLQSIAAITVVWCFNGFFQALMWPPLVRIQSENMTEEQYAVSIRNVSAASSVATIAIYVIVPLAISISGWRIAFLFAAAAALVTILIWYKGTANIKEGSVALQKDNSQTSSLKGSGIILFLLPIMIAIVLQGTLRDGITTWMPSYISEVFNMGTSASILTGAVLPIFSIFSVSIATSLERKIGNPVKTGALLFGIGLFGCAVMIPLYKVSVFICIFLMALITACMHGVNIMLIGRIPAYFQKYGKVSTISGILNSCTYIGSAASTYGFAVLSDNFGWSITICCWAVLGLLGTLLCIICIKHWKKIFQ